jgi:hypothetical protein
VARQSHKSKVPSALISPAEWIFSMSVVFIFWIEDG